LATLPPKPLGPPSDRISILFVDDDTGILETLVDIFEDMGFDADTASSGRQALAKIQERFYHLALLDIQLPDMLGTELLSRIRKIQPDTKCVMATGNASIPSALDSLNEGAYAYLLKPIEVPNVKATVRRALEQQRLELENRRLLMELQALGNMTDAGLSTLELDQLLDRVLHQLVVYHGADAGVIFLMDATTGMLAPRARHAHPHDGAENLPEAFPVALGVGVAGRAAQQSEVLAAAGPELDGDPAQAEGVQALLAAPLFARHQLIGVVRLDWRRPTEFTADSPTLLRVLAERAGVLIDNARLYDAERHLRSEAETFSQLSRSLVERIGLEERLELITRHLAGVTGVSGCIVWLGTRDALVPAYITGMDADRQRRMKRMAIPLEEFSPALRRVLDSDNAVVIEDARAVELLPERDLELWGIRSALLTPLRSGGRSIGLAAVYEPGADCQFTDRQVRQAEVIAYVAAVALQQAKMIQEERDMARTLAESFLSKTPQLANVQVASCFVPASEVALVGGDYFDFIELDNDLIGMVIGDVCGKGLAAAIYTAMAKYMLRAYALENPSPQWVISRLNQALYNQMSEECMFITMVYGVLDRKQGTFTYTNAAHPPPILYQPESKTIMELAPTGGMVGAVIEMQFTEETVALEPGSVLTMFTDGVTEARTDQTMLENEGVREVVQAHAGEDAGSIATAIYNRALEFASGVLRDDVAIVVVKNE